MVVGIMYWVAWRIVLPRVLGYKLVPRKEALPDGTVVTLVSVFSGLLPIVIDSACSSRTVRCTRVVPSFHMGAIYYGR